MADVGAQLTNWIAGRRPDWKALSLDRLRLDHGGGWSAEIFFADISHGPADRRISVPLVVRRQSGTFDLVLGGGLQLQADMMHALEQHPDVPSPALIGIELDEGVIGAPFLVMERVAGRAATQAPNYNLSGWLAEMEPAARAGCWRHGIEAFAQLHRIDWRDGFAFLDRPERGSIALDQYLDYLVEWYHWAGKGRPQPIVEQALDHLLRARPAAAGTSVLWGDATPSNILFRPDGSIAALIDWELAALGPGEIDLAWWLYFDDLFSAGFGVERLAGLPDRRTSIEIYEQAIGRAVDSMHYYDVLTGVRMAIVVARQFDRQVALGKIAPENRSLTDNLMTVHLARILALPEPQLGPDFEAFLGTHIHAEN